MSRALLISLLFTISACKPVEEELVVDVDGDGFYSNVDCDDHDAGIYPGADEHCDGVDEDCDGRIDEESLYSATYFTDADGDGFGDPSTVVRACSLPQGAVENDQDCDDEDAAVHPGADERCDGYDDDCDGIVDSGAIDEGTWYLDHDGDGFGDPEIWVKACAMDKVIWVADNTDCNDLIPWTYPGAVEICDRADNNCNDLVDESPFAAPTWYLDADGDGFGDDGVSAVSCQAPVDHVALPGDCLDTDDRVFPGADEVCNHLDDDCDGLTDDDDPELLLRTATEWFRDVDSDGFGAPSRPTLSCVGPAHTAANADDCDDEDPAVYPGAEERWYDGVDADCALDGDYDQDGDGVDSSWYGGDDCDDTDPAKQAACRPAVACARPSLETLSAEAMAGTDDLAFTPTCLAVMSTTRSGQDYVFTVAPDGERVSYAGVGENNTSAVAVDPVDGALVAGSAADQGLWRMDGADLVQVVMSGAQYLGNGADNPYANAYMSNSPTSIAVDLAGDTWFPDWGALGTLAQIGPDGAITSWDLGEAKLQSLALTSDQTLLVVVGSAVYRFDQGAGALVAWYEAGDEVLDLAVDYNDEVYLETVAGEIQRVSADGAVSELYGQVSGQAKLAISPDGWLVRLIGAPTGAPSFDALQLPE
ncbi:MAG: putative metal-binding motif-containing protein [Deltaproteobacteria bacterium]|nr:putative metal-binding motif-containing protein [Deltaproteobacteria bacterium]